VAEEAAYAVTKQFHTIRGNSLDDFKANVEAVLGEGAFAGVSDSFKAAYGVLDAVEAQAIANVQAAMPGTTVITQPQVPSIGGVAQPQAQPQVATEATPPVPPVNPKTGAPFLNPKWVPAGVSRKTNKPYPGFWAEA